MPRCFKKANAANCSVTERLAASRRYGIVRREKYRAFPAELTTTFTTLGLSYSSTRSIRAAAVDISSRSRAAATLSITCLLYTSDAADERSSVDLGGRR